MEDLGDLDPTLWWVSSVDFRVDYEDKSAEEITPTLKGLFCGCVPPTMVPAFFLNGDGGITGPRRTVPNNTNSGVRDIRGWL